jgi:hypothetical protein
MPVAPVIPGLGFAPFAPAFPPTLPPYPYAPPSGYALAPYRSILVTGQNAPPPAPKGYMEKTTDFLKEETGPLPNWGWIGLATATALGIYGYNEGWFR